MEIEKDSNNNIDKEKYLSSIKKTLAKWFFIGLISPFIWHPVATAFVSEKAVDFSAKGLLIALFIYEIIRNKNKPPVVTSENYQSKFILGAIEAFLLGVVVFLLPFNI